MKPYLINACNSQYHIELLEPNTQWKFNVAQLKEKNVHKVPDKSIKGMKEKYTVSWFLNWCAAHVYKLFLLPVFSDRGSFKTLQIAKYEPKSFTRNKTTYGANVDPLGIGAKNFK